MVSEFFRFMLFKFNLPVKTKFFNSQKGKDQKYRKQIADQTPSAFCSNQYIINPMENYTGPKCTDNSGNHDPLLLKYIGDSTAECDSTQKVKGTSRCPADQDIGKISCTIFCKIAYVFKCSKSNCDSDCRRYHIPFVRFKYQQIKQKWEKL